MMPETHGLFYKLIFYIFGLTGIASALAFVTRKSPVAAALWLVNTLFCLAALFIMLDAQFIGVIQVMVYAGAIMVVFLFVVMLLNLGHASDVTDIRGTWGKLIAGLIGIALAAQILVIVRGRLPSMSVAGPTASGENVIDSLARPLFNEYLLAFEITSVLLLAAIIGAVLLAKRRA